jgi:hypothetical protein
MLKAVVFSFRTKEDGRGTIASKSSVIPWYHRVLAGYEPETDAA